MSAAQATPGLFDALFKTNPDTKRHDSLHCSVYFACG